MFERIVTRSGLVRFAILGGAAAALAPLDSLAASLDTRVTLTSSQLRDLLVVAQASMGDGQILSDRIIGPEGHVTNGGFFQRWMELGPVLGLALYGWPISNLEDETLEDKKSYKVQYFERTRMEYHTENQPPYHILLGQFGRQVYALRHGGGGSGNSSSVGSPDAQAQPGPMGWPFSLDHNPNLYSLKNSAWSSAPRGVWFHPSHRPDLGDDGNWSYFTTWAITREVNCHFRDNVNSGEASVWVSEYFELEFAILTTGKWRSQFLGGKTGPVQLNIRGVPGSWVSLIGPDGKVRATAQASDLGDVTINLPDECRITVAIAGRIHDKNGELILRLGPTERTDDIDLINGPDHQW